MLAGGDEGPVWLYEIQFTQDKQRRAIVKRERVMRDNTQILNRPDGDDMGDPERLTQTHLEQVNVNRQFRELADFFASIRYLHIVPQLVREPDRWVGRKNDPYGGDFLQQIARTLLYIRFRETTVTTEHLAEGISADYDSEGRLAGIEILDAIKQLGDPSVFQQAILEDVAKPKSM